MSDNLVVTNDVDVQQGMYLLKLPSDGGKGDVSISSSISDMDSPIYSPDNLTIQHENGVSSRCRKVKE